MDLAARFLYGIDVAVWEGWTRTAGQTGWLHEPVPLAEVMMTTPPAPLDRLLLPPEEFTRPGATWVFLNLGTRASLRP
ncbi:hypothetical protein ASPCADRAFT_130683 [Aspergillus carbonarius ITEM 5010]|uniref:Uncharacterized protein n=1 Tax=Aspergillus carbonarius (strain ITEM 5010) TaxID=602072 RepID=A0A1R3RL28_ASPC5|nr:hypothetical protein ASPCADRAFT_130683 [Aspergillus carbonarius ITEM 5010]